MHVTIFIFLSLYADKKSKESGKGGKGAAGLTKGPTTAKGDGGRKSKNVEKDIGGKVGRTKRKEKKESEILFSEQCI